MKKNDKYKDILVIVTGLLVLFYFFEKKGLFYSAIIIGLCSVFIPVIGDWIVRAWYKLAEVLGWVNSRILLSLIFFLFLLPFAIISRILKRDELSLKKKDADSLFVVRNHTYTNKDLENIW